MDVKGIISALVLDSNLFVGTYNGLFHSPNLGMTYDTSLTWTWVYSIAAGKDRSGNTNIFVGTNHGVFRSTNNGKNWYQVNNGLTDSTDSTVEVLAFSDTLLYAGTYSDGIYVSSNYGETWAQTSMKYAYTYSIFTYDGTVFVANGGGGFYSTNNGVSWNRIDSDLVTPYYSPSIKVFTVCGENLFVGTSAGLWRKPLSQVITSVSFQADNTPKLFSLNQNYPNPFNPATTICFNLKEKSGVVLEIFNVLGQRIKSFALGQLGVGTYAQQVDMSTEASGVYIYRLDAVGKDEERFVVSKTMVLIK